MNEAVANKGSESGRQERSVLGWRVFLSTGVAERCLKVPEGVFEQTTGDRIRDLLSFLEFYLKQAPVRVYGDVNAGFRFPMNVVNENRKRSEYGDGPEMPGTTVLLWVFATIDQGGTPALIVTTEEEAPRA